MLKLHCCQQSPESASSEINEHWTCSERADGNMRAHKLINIVYWIEWQTNKKRSDLGDLCFIDSNESVIK